MKRPDTPLATTPITILDDLQNASIERLKLKREVRKKRESKPIQSNTRKIQGLASLQNTLGKKTKRK